MRDPRGSRNRWWMTFGATVVAVWVAFKLPDDGQHFNLQTVLGFSGFTVMPFALILAVIRTFDAWRQARMRRGEGVIARWTMTPAAWREWMELYRTIEERAPVTNELNVASAGTESVTRGGDGAVEVVIADNAVTVGAEFCSIGRNVAVAIHGGWMEFDELMSNPDGQDWHKMVRVPIAPGAERDAVRVQQHYTRAYIAAASSPRLKIYVALGFFGFFALVILLAYWATGGK